MREWCGELPVPTAVARFDGLVEFVNFVLALAIMAAAWTLVVEALAFVDRHAGPTRHWRRAR